MSQSEVDLSQVFQQISQAVDQLSQAWATAARSIADSMPEPAKAEKPDRFEHTDGDDNLVVRPHHAFDQTLVTFVNGDGVRLRQDAVNRLAQYLDQYRTDQQDCDVEVPEQCGRANPFAHTGYASGAPEPLRHWCGRNSDHPGHEYVGVSSQQSMRCLGVSNGVYGS